MSNLKAIKRESASTGSTNKLRATGFIPAILYGGKDPNQKISIEKKKLHSFLKYYQKKSRILIQKLKVQLILKKHLILIIPWIKLRKIIVILVLNL